jgi:hypothetical protein
VSIYPLPSDPQPSRAKPEFDPQNLCSSVSICGSHLANALSSFALFA